MTLAGVFSRQLTADMNAARTITSTLVEPLSVPPQAPLASCDGRVSGTAPARDRTERYSEHGFVANQLGDAR